MKTFEEDVTALYEKRLAKLEKKLEDVKARYNYFDYGMKAYEKQDKVTAEIDDLKKKYSAFLSAQNLRFQLQMAKDREQQWNLLSSQALTALAVYDHQEAEKIRNRWKDLRK